MIRWLRAQELGPSRIAIYLGGFGLAGYAALQLVPANPVGVTIWFVAAIIGHDLLLLPIYGLAHHGALEAFRRRGWSRWIGHLRVPTMMSGILLLIFFPLILDSATHAWRWLFVSAVLFVASGLWLLVRYGYQRVRTRC